jgi:hypothetical protein
MNFFNFLTFLHFAPTAIIPALGAGAQGKEGCRQQSGTSAPGVAAPKMHLLHADEPPAPADRLPPHRIASRHSKSRPEFSTPWTAFLSLGN